MAKVTMEQYKDLLVQFIKEGGWIGQNGNYFYPRHRCELKRFITEMQGISPTTICDGISLALREVPDLWNIASENCSKDIGQYAVSKRYKCDPYAFTMSYDEFGLIKNAR